jgi:hypothetical protein
MRFHTHECRWFFDGPPPSDVVGWFREVTPWQRDPGVESPAWPSRWREDRYLTLSGRDDLGIKSRSEPAHGGGLWARMEIKGRAAELGHVELAAGVDGLVERWVKWSHPADGVPAALRAMMTGPDAVTVRKKRLLRRVRLRPGDLAVEIPPEVPPPGRGLSVEVTHVEAEGRAFWTVGLEAHPWEEGIHVAFVVTAASLFESYPGTSPLGVDRSWSYPAWLLRQAGPAGQG